MVLVVLALVVLGTFVPLMRSAAKGSWTAASLGVVETALLTGGAAVAAIAAFFLRALRCDESCDENVVPEVRRGTWWHTIDAWQWNAQFAAALLALGAAVLAFVFVIRRRYTRAAIAVAGGLGCFCIWALLVAPLGELFGI